MSSVIEDYLSDGVYVTFDGFAYTLDLREQGPTLPITKIVMEPGVIDALNRFRTRMNSMTREQLEAAAGGQPGD